MTDSRPLISVVHIIYNQVGTIEVALKSVLEQDYSPLEIIISDDASNDGTFDHVKRMVDDYRGQHRIILNRNEKNLGIVGNLNKAISLSSGSLIVQANGDDICSSDRVSKLCGAWMKDRQNIKLLFSDLDRIDKNGTYLKSARPTSLTCNSPSPQEVITRNRFIVGASTAYTPDLFQTLGPIPGMAVVEDHVIPFRASLFGRIVKVEKPLVQWRTGGKSWTDARQKDHPDFVFGEEALDGWIRYAQNHKAFLEDCAKLDFSGKKESMRYSRKYIFKVDYLLRIAKLSLFHLILILPYSYFLSFNKRDLFFLKKNLKYLFRFALYPIMLHSYKEKWRGTDNKSV